MRNFEHPHEWHIKKHSSECKGYRSLNGAKSFPIQSAVTWIAFSSLSKAVFTANRNLTSRTHIGSIKWNSFHAERFIDKTAGDAITLGVLWSSSYDLYLFNNFIFLSGSETLKPANKRNVTPEVMLPKNPSGKEVLWRNARVLGHQKGAAALFLIGEDAAATKPIFPIPIKVKNDIINRRWSKM